MSEYKDNIRKTTLLYCEQLQYSDTDAINKLYALYETRLNNLAKNTYKRLGNSLLSESDILSEAFLSFHHVCMRYNEDIQADIMTLVSLNLTRKLKLMHDNIAPLSEILTFEGDWHKRSDIIADKLSYNNTDNLVLRNIAFENLRNSIHDSLSDEYTEILKLRFEDELTLAQIGERIGKPVGSIKHRIDTALMKLRSPYRSNGYKWYLCEK